MVFINIVFPNRKPTLHEIEEDRLWHGKQYKNLPETSGQIPTDVSKETAQGTSLTLGMEESYLPVDGQGTSGEQSKEETEEQRLIRLRMKQQEEHQQIEARNRYK